MCTCVCPCVLCIYGSVYVGMCVYLYVDMCAHVYVCYMSVSVCICVLMSVYACACVRVNMLPVCFCQCVHVSVSVSLCADLCVCPCECACECVCSCLCVCVCKHTLGCDSWKPTLSGRHPNSPRSRLLWSLSSVPWTVEGTGPRVLWTIAVSILYIPSAQKTLGNTYR